MCAVVLFHARGYDSSVESSSRAARRPKRCSTRWGGRTRPPSRGSAPRIRESPAGIGQDASAFDLRDAELVVARERGMSSWPRWRRFAGAGSSTRPAARSDLCAPRAAGDIVHASLLLDAEPALARFDLFTECALARRITSRTCWCAIRRARSRPGGPLDRAPILYACFSRFLRGIRRVSTASCGSCVRS